MKKTMLVLALMAMAAMIAAPAFAELWETFSYADGEMVGNGGWTGQSGIVTVEAGEAKVTYNDALKPLNTLGKIQQGGLNLSGVVYWYAEVYAGTTMGDNAFDMTVNSATGLNFGRWYGSDSSERPRIGGSGAVLDTQWFITEPASTLWHQLAVVIDTNAGTSTFSFDGNVLGTLNYAANGGPAVGVAVDNITIGLQNAGTAVNGQYKFYDNIYLGNNVEGYVVTPEPSSFAALGMFGLGALGYIKRRRA